MHFSEFQIDGFGLLSGLPLQNLQPGLNVIHGTNGSGKTTLIHFVRGVLCGFDDARRLRLLPPWKAGSPGGSVGVRYQGAHYAIIRHARPDHQDTVAINHSRGRAEDVPQLRQWISQLDRASVFSLYAATSFESHSLDALLKLALRDRIPLQSRQQPVHWLTERIEQARRERQDLFSSTPQNSKLLELERRLSSLRSEEAELSRELTAAHDRWASQIRQLQEQLDQRQREIDWLHTELQQVQADLAETQGRLWSHQEVTQLESRVVERVAGAGPDELQLLEERILHLQRTLQELAGSRLQVSVRSAELAGVEQPTVETFFRRQRKSLAELEGQLNGLRQLELQLAERAPAGICSCQQVRHTLAAAIREMQEQVYLLCRELSRHQSLDRWLQLRGERAGIDQCEVEVLNEIHRLRIRREELLAARVTASSGSLQQRDQFESSFCECTGHEHFLASHSVWPGSPSTRQQVVVTERALRVSLARPGDAEREQELLTRCRQLQQQWWRAQRSWCATRQQLLELQLQPARFAAQTVLDEKRAACKLAEQELADAREQWQSLAALQQVLQLTQSRLAVEQAAPVIEEASRLLRRLTRDRYQRFVFDEDAQALFVTAESIGQLAVNALSRGTLDQAVLAFRLALASEYLRRGQNLPLLLDDVLNDSDEDRLSIAAEVLVEYGQRQQILFFTCQEHLANLFESLGVPVHDLPGSQRKPSRALPARPQTLVSVTPPAPAVVTAVPGAESVEPRPLRAPVVVGLTEPLQSEAVYAASSEPPQRYWLQPDSPIMTVPSLGAQMARRLGALGVRQVADLVDLDPESTEIPLDSLQISATTLRQWQAECRLLCCVPRLTGQDAQALVAVGVMSPRELAEADVTDLQQRISRLRDRSGEHLALTWLVQQPHWPSLETVRLWIRQARRSRSFREARESSRRRRHPRNLRERQQRLLSALPRATRIISDTELRATKPPYADDDARDSRSHGATERSHSRVAEPVELHLPSSVATGELDRPRRYFLQRDSAIVDAPSIGPKMAERLNRIGIHTVHDLLNRDAAAIAARLQEPRITAQTITEWQQQARLMMTIPELRGHDVQVLVAVGITDPARVAAFKPATLFALVEPFVTSREGQRLLRSSKTPDLEEVAEWIDNAQYASSLKAAG